MRREIAEGASTKRPCLRSRVLYSLLPLLIKEECKTEKIYLQKLFLTCRIKHKGLTEILTADDCYMTQVVVVMRGSLLVKYFCWTFLS